MVGYFIYIPAATAAAQLQIGTILHNGFYPRKTNGQSTGATNVLYAMTRR